MDYLLTWWALTRVSVSGDVVTLSIATCLRFIFTDIVGGKNLALCGSIPFAKTVANWKGDDFIITIPRYTNTIAMAVLHPLCRTPIKILFTLWAIVTRRATAVVAANKIIVACSTIVTRIRTAGIFLLAVCMCVGGGRGR